MHTHTHTHTQSLLSCTPLSPTATPQRNSVHYLLYLADNLAYFPYNTLEEPLFVIHETDMAMAVHGAAVYQGFREVRTCRGAMVSTMVPSACTPNSLEMEMSSSSAFVANCCCHLDGTWWLVKWHKHGSLLLMS